MYLFCVIHNLYQAQKIVKARRMLEHAGRRDAEIQLIAPSMQPSHSDTADTFCPVSRSTGARTLTKH